MRTVRPLAADFTDDARRPDFLWDEDLSIAEFKEALAAGGDEGDRVPGKMLREANDQDVWRFVTPQQVANALPRQLFLSGGAALAGFPACRPRQGWQLHSGDAGLAADVVSDPALGAAPQTSCARSVC